MVMSEGVTDEGQDRKDRRTDGEDDLPTVDITHRPRVTLLRWYPVKLFLFAAVNLQMFLHNERRNVLPHYITKRVRL